MNENVESKPKKRLFLKIGIFLFATILIGIGVAVGIVYRELWRPNVDLKNKNSIYFYIRSNSTFEEVLLNLEKQKILIDKNSFEWAADVKNYVNNVKAGRYLIKNSLTNNELINLLRSGKQEPINFGFSQLRLKTQLAGKIAQQIEADSVSIMKVLNDNDFLSRFGFNSQNISAIFIPNTYQINWNTSATQFVERMYGEYQKFWNDERKAKLQKTGLTQLEVSVLASIVQGEQNKYNDEKPVIAGLYLNRLKKEMLLQADPTVIFAVGDFTIRRVLNKHKETDSPFNTYKYKGLPPAPINIPEISSLDAVLNFDNNDYIYMCAKDDFSGYHNFAKTLEQHNINAKKYHIAFDKREREREKESRKKQK